MICPNIQLLFWVVVIFTFAVNGVVMWRFLPYCRMIARIERCEWEYREGKAIDDGGFNEYMLQQWNGLYGKRYLEFSDDALTKIGDNLHLWQLTGNICAVFMMVLGFFAYGGITCK